MFLSRTRNVSVTPSEKSVLKTASMQTQCSHYFQLTKHDHKVYVISVCMSYRRVIKT